MGVGTMSAATKTEDFEVIIIPTDKCPCGTHKGELVDMIIYRTVPWGVFHKIEIHCDYTDKIYEMMPLFSEQS
jgi:hypothetical protein